MKIKHMAAMAFATMAFTACNTKNVAEADNLFLIVGSYSSADDEGVRVYTFDESTGEATYISGIKGIENPSFVYPSADGTRVYTVGENFEAAKGTANALAFDAEKGVLTLLNTQPTHGDAPCNIIVSPDGKWVYTSNYNGGSITEFGLDAEGKLEEGRVIPFHGTSVDTLRQTQPHLHAVNFTPDGRFLLADDLGTDKVHIFPAAAPLDTAQCYDLKMPPAMGPRHLCFHPNGRTAYLLGEISGDVIKIDYNGDENGQDVSSTFSTAQSLRADSLGAEGSADIHISADGKFIYASHRLKGDGISVIRILPDGMMEKVGYQATGIHPRNFTISPDGNWLLVACRDDNVVEIYARDAQTGLLKNTGHTIEMAKPVCLQWVDHR